jgi:gas vesicle protein
MSKDSDSSLKAFLFGGIIGVVCGLLFAPRKGEETRQIVSKVLDEVQEKGLDVLDKTKDTAEDIHKKSKDILEDGKEKIDNVVAKGKEILHNTDSEDAKDK